MSITKELLKKHVDANQARVEAEAKRIGNLMPHLKRENAPSEFAVLLTPELSDANDLMTRSGVDSMRTWSPDFDIAWAVDAELNRSEAFGSEKYFDEVIAAEAAGLIELSAEARFLFVDRDLASKVN